MYVYIYIFEKYCIDVITVISACRFLSFSINLRYSILILSSCGGLFDIVHSSST